MRDWFEEHYRNNFRRFVGQLSKRHGWHNAEDIVQDAYIRALEQGPFHSYETLDHWMKKEVFFRGKIHNREEQRQKEIKNNAADLNKAVSSVVGKDADKQSKQVADATPASGVYRQQPDASQPVGLVGVPSPDPEQIYFYNLDVRQLQDLIQDRSERHASILTMAILWQEPYGKIKARTGAPVGTIWRVVHEFRQEAAAHFA